MERNEPTARPELGPWFVVAVVIVVGIVLFFAFGPDTTPAVTPSGMAVTQ